MEVKMPEKKETHCRDCAGFIFCESWGEYKCKYRSMLLHSNDIKAYNCPNFKKSESEKDHECHCEACEMARNREKNE